MTRLTVDSFRTQVESLGYVLHVNTGTSKLSLKYEVWIPGQECFASASKLAECKEQFEQKHDKRVNIPATIAQNQRNAQLFKECYALGALPALDGTLAEDEEAMSALLVKAADSRKAAARRITSVPSGVGFANPGYTLKGYGRTVTRKANRWHRELASA